MKVSVSIVIPVHNGCELLRALLVSIGRQTAEPLEVIVVDNGSTDAAAEVASGLGAQVIAMGRNAGFAAAVNRGIQVAKGEGIALVNSDVELDRGWLETLWSSACETGSGFATGKILQAGTEDTLDGAFDLICRGGCSWRAGAGRLESRMSTPQPIRFCSATAVIYRASVFQTVGLFAETFDSYLEDVDFGLRCAASQLGGWYFPAAVCRHHGSATFGRWSPRVVRLIARNQVFLIARHYPGRLIRRWIWPILIGHVLWGGLAIRHGCGIAWLLGKMEGVWRFSSARRRGIVDLASVILESEGEIYRLQAADGFDAYWSLYFRLVGQMK